MDRQSPDGLISLQHLALIMIEFEHNGRGGMHFYIQIKKNSDQIQIVKIYKNTSIGDN